MLQGTVAVILVGGEGTRLRPLTTNIPKPMVPIVNRPFLEHVIDYLKGYGVNEIVLALCYLSDCIQGHFGDGSALGARLIYEVEERPLGTAGAVKNLEGHLKSTFLVFNGDIFTDLDLGAMMAFHREKRAKATIALTPVENPTLYGVVETDSGDRVERFIEKPSWDAVTTNMINAGTYILEPEVLQYVPSGVHYTFEHGLFPLLLKMDLPIYGYKSAAYWIDIGKPENYFQLHHDLLIGKIVRPFSGKPLANDIWVGEGCVIHPLARIKGPAVIGDNCTIGSKVHLAGPTVLGRGCRIGEAALIEGVVLWENSRVGRGVTLKNCVVGSSCVVGKDSCILDGSILGDNVVIGRGNKLEHGVRVWSGKVLKPNTISF